MNNTEKLVIFAYTNYEIMKKYIFYLLSSIFLISCSSESEYTNENNQNFNKKNIKDPSLISEILTNTKNTFEVRVDANDTLVYYKSDVVSVGNVVSKIIVSLESDTLYQMKYQVEVEDDFRLIQHKNVILKSEQEITATNLLFKDYQNLSTTFQNVSEFITNNIIEIDGNTEHIHSLYFQDAIINTIKRAKKNSDSCACSPTPEYILNKSMFACQEDVKYPISLIKDVFIEN